MQAQMSAGPPAHGRPNLALTLIQPAMIHRLNQGGNGIGMWLLPGFPGPPHRTRGGVVNCGRGASFSKSSWWTVPQRAGWAGSVFPHQSLPVTEAALRLPGHWQPAALGHDILALAAGKGSTPPGSPPRRVSHFPPRPPPKRTLNSSSATPPEKKPASPSPPSAGVNGSAPSCPPAGRIHANHPDSATSSATFPAWAGMK